MSRLSRLAPRDLDALSAYADGALAPADQRAMEKRLERDPELRQALREIRATSALLRALPQVRPPRDFTLTPQMAGVRSGWLRTPLLQLATAVAVAAFIITVGVDVFGVMLPGSAFRAAMPAQELAVEASAEFAAADALEAGAASAVAETAVADKAVVEETAGVAAAPMEMLAATPAAEAQAEEYANHGVPTVGVAAEIPPAPAQAATAAPVREAGPTGDGECEACGPDLELPTAVMQDQAAVTAVPEEAWATQETAGHMVETPAEEPVSGAHVRGGLPAVRWIEIGLGAIALFLGAVTLWARRRAR